MGYCVSMRPGPPAGLDPRKLKDVAEVLDPVPLIDARMLELDAAGWPSITSARGARPWIRRCRRGSGTRPARGWERSCWSPRRSARRSRNSRSSPGSRPSRPPRWRCFARTDEPLDDLRRLPARQVHRAPVLALAAAGPGAFGPAPAVLRARRVGAGIGGRPAATRRDDAATGSARPTARPPQHAGPTSPAGADRRAGSRPWPALTPALRATPSPRS